MARLESDLKLGFYPTSLETLKKIFNRVEIINEEIERPLKVLDPCCGMGEAIGFIKKSIHNSIKTESYGVELDIERGKEAIHNVDYFLAGSAFSTILYSKTFDFLFLNPPYGTHYIDDVQQRLEISFVEFFANTISLNGYMLLVISKNLFKDPMSHTIGTTLSQYGFKVEKVFYDETNSDYKKYNQFFILLKRVNGNKRASFSIEKNIKIGTEFLSQMDFSNAVEINSIEKICLNFKLKKSRNFSFKSRESIPEWQIGKVLEKNQRAFKNAIEKLNSKRINVSNLSSVDSPNEGQSIILMMNGLIHNSIAGFLIKGKTEKKEVLSDKELTDAYVAKLFGFNTQTKRFCIFE